MIYNFIIAEKNREYISFVDVDEYSINIKQVDKNKAFKGFDAYYDNLFEIVPKINILNNEDAKCLLEKTLKEAYIKIEEICDKNRIYNSTDNNFTFSFLKN